MIWQLLSNKFSGETGVNFGPAVALFRCQTIHSIQERLKKKWGVVLLEQTILCLHHKTYQEILHSGSAQIYALRKSDFFKCDLGKKIACECFSHISCMKPVFCHLEFWPGCVRQVQHVTQAKANWSFFYKVTINYPFVLPTLHLS